MSFKYKRGLYVRDKVTGFEGVIVARQDHITNCNCYFVQPPVDKDGKFMEGKYLDEYAVEPLQKDRLDLNADDQPPG